MVLEHFSSASLEKYHVLLFLEEFEEFFFEVFEEFMQLAKGPIEAYLFKYFLL